MPRTTKPTPILPLTHGEPLAPLRLVKGNHALSAADYALILEALRIAQMVLLDLADRTEHILPMAETARERFAIYAENMADLGNVVSALVRRA